MKVVKQNKDFDIGVFFLEEDRNISFTFGGNGDLYLAIHSQTNGEKHDFIITKENYEVYKLFEQLFVDIENINIFDEIDIPLDMEDEEEINEYIFYKKKEIEEEKNRYRFENYGNYNKLFDNKNKIITWHSDEAFYDTSNILKIKKEEETFKIEFSIQPSIEGYEEDFHSLKYIPIRFRNSGSSYFPFNMLFMKMYNNLKEIDDVTDYGHQIHMEEYLYNNKVKKLKK